MVASCNKLCILIKLLHTMCYLNAELAHPHDRAVFFALLAASFRFAFLTIHNGNSC